MKQVKVPSSVQDAFAEASALEYLASQLNRGWWFSPKAMTYQMKADKIKLLAWRALHEAHPEVAINWTYSPLTGVASAPADPAPEKPKKPRAPRVPRASKVKDVVPTAAPEVK